MNLNKDYYTLLKEFQKNYPELTFNNNGYEYLSKDIRERHKIEIEYISKLLKETLKNFVKFNNFKIDKGGNILIRYQGHYSESFTGVIYLDIGYFKNINNE